MKIARTIGLCLLMLSLLNSACDAGRSAYATAAVADRQGDVGVDIPALYDEVCARAPASPRCGVARHRAAELRLERSLKALREGRFREAITLLDQATKEPSVTLAATTIGASNDFVQAKRYEEAVAKPDKLAALLLMADEDTTVVARAAQSWLEKVGPQPLLDGVKVACRAGGQGSCFELAQRFYKIYPEAPEAQQVASLVKAERDRQETFLKRAENFLVQRLMIFDREKKIERCAAENRLESDALLACTARESPPNVEVMPTVTFLHDAWQKNLVALTDLSLIKHFEARWQRVGETGENDPDTDLYPEKATGTGLKAGSK